MYWFLNNRQSQICFRFITNGSCGNFLFEMFPAGSRIVVYGAGNIGRHMSINSNYQVIVLLQCGLIKT